MRAVRVGSDGLRLVEADRLPLGPTDVLVTVEACGVCYHDYLVGQGLIAGANGDITLGHEVAGTIAEIGAAVSNLAVGDFVALTPRVGCLRCRACLAGREPQCPQPQATLGFDMDGGYAEYVRVPEAAAVVLPRTVPPEHAAILCCAIGTALNAVRDKAGIHPGDRVLVTGAGGGVGTHCVQLARHFGGEVIAQTGSPEKGPALKRLGADEVAVGRGPELAAELRRCAGEQGINVVLDNVGSPIFRWLLPFLASGARFVLIGELTGETVRLNLAKAILGELTFVGTRNGSRRHLIDVIGLVARGVLHPVVAEALPLESAPAAHKRLASGSTLGRLVLMPGLSPFALR